MHLCHIPQCTCVNISVTKWCIVGYGTDAFWDLWDGSIVQLEGCWSNLWVDLITVCQHITCRPQYPKLCLWTACGWMLLSWASYDSRMFFIFLLKPIEAKHGFSYMKLVTKLDNEWCAYGSTVWTRVGFRIRTALYDTILHIGLQWPNHNTDHALSSHANSLSRYGYFLWLFF